MAMIDGGKGENDLAISFLRLKGIASEQVKCKRRKGRENLKLEDVRGTEVPDHETGLPKVYANTKLFDVLVQGCTAS